MENEGSLGGYVLRSLVGRRHQAGETCSSQAARCLPNQRYPLLHQHQRASLALRQPLPLLLLTPHRLLLQPWRLSLQTNRASPLYLKRTFWKVAFRGRAGQFAVL